MGAKSFSIALSQAKPEIDQLFLNGINHIFFHGTCLQPQGRSLARMALLCVNGVQSRNAIWRDVPLLNEYITRCQSILQSGTHDNDIAVYWPIYDIWHTGEGMEQMLTVHHHEFITSSVCGNIAKQLIAEGFALTLSRTANYWPVKAAAIKRFLFHRRLICRLRRCKSFLTFQLMVSR